MKRTVIRYKVIGDDEILITSIENAPSLGQITERFRKTIRFRYLNGGHPYYLGEVIEVPLTATLNNTINDVNAVIIWMNPDEHILISEKRTYTRVEFEQAIVQMKLAENRLQKIRKSVESVEEKEIVI